MFEGVVGQSFRSDIALDDIRILDGQCPPPGSCTFEFDMCGYNNGHHLGDQFDWLRTSGTTLTAGTGPQVDHTTNSDQGRE